MKNKYCKSAYIIGIGAALIVGAMAIPASASDFGGGFIGADIGVGRDKLTGDVSADSKNALAGGVEGGYNWDMGVSNWLLGVDGFYDQTKSKSRFLTDSITPANSGNVNFGDRTYGVDGKAGYVLGKWLPYVKLGLGKIKGTNDLSSYSTNGTHLGLGAEYKIADQWSLGGELSRFQGKVKDGAKGVNTSLFMTLKYYFGSPAPMAAAPLAAAAVMPEPVAAPVPPPAPVAPPKPAPAPMPRMEKLTLSATELFAFDSDVLAQPQPKLDELAQVLNSHLEIGSVTVNGYTDRLGADKYNLKLSQRRADAVKAYLVGKGANANRINAVGKGKANPVVDCKDKKRSALIKCLEPNRRIEVEQITYEKRVN